MKNLEESLIEAIKNGDTQFAKEIIRMQSDTIYWLKIFQIAAEKGNTEILKFMEPIFREIEKETEDDDNAWQEVSDRFAIAFSDAFYNGHCEATRYIGETYEWWHDEGVLLYRMHKCGYRNYVATLMNNCIDNSIIKSAISEACTKGDLKSIKYFIKSCNLVIEYYEYLICEAAEEGHLNIVRFLVKKGATGLKGALISAIRTLQLGDIRDMLVDGVPIPKKEISTSYRSKRIKIIKFLIENGAPVLTNKDKRETCDLIFYFCVIGDLKSIKFYTDLWGIDLNKCDLLFYVAIMWHLDVFEYLVKNGVKHLSKRLALEVVKSAFGDGNLKSAKYFIKLHNLKIEEYQSDLYHASVTGNLDCVKFLVNKGADLSQKFTDEEKCAALCVRDMHSRLSSILKNGNISKSEIKHLQISIAELEEIDDYLLPMTKKHYPEVLFWEAGKPK